MGWPYGSEYKGCRRAVMTRPGLENPDLLQSTIALIAFLPAALSDAGIQLLRSVVMNVQSISENFIVVRGIIIHILLFLFLE